MRRCQLDPFRAFFSSRCRGWGWLQVQQGNPAKREAKTEMLEVRPKQAAQDLLVAPPFVEMPAHGESSTSIPVRWLYYGMIWISPRQGPGNPATHLDCPRNVRSEL